MRQLPAVGEATPISKPYLAFSSTGHDLNMTHDLPVSKPFGPAGRLRNDMSRNSPAPVLCLRSWGRRVEHSLRWILYNVAQQFVGLVAA